MCRSCNIGVLRANGWMYQDATWYTGRPQPRPHCVTWGPSSHHGKWHISPTFRPSLLWYGPSCQQKAELLFAIAWQHNSLSYTDTYMHHHNTCSFIALGIICAWSYAPRHSAPLVNTCIDVSTAPCTHPPSSTTEFHRALDSVRKLIICHLPAIT